MHWINAPHGLYKLDDFSVIMVRPRSKAFVIAGMGEETQGDAYVPLTKEFNTREEADKELQEIAKFLNDPTPQYHVINKIGDDEYKF